MLGVMRDGMLDGMLDAMQAVMHEDMLDRHGRIACSTGMADGILDG